MGCNSVISLVLHAFQKKSRRKKTPRLEIDLIRDRLEALKEMLR
jgi:phage-related protein